MSRRARVATLLLGIVLVAIALYPDPLVAQTLMASTYPLEVIEAARFAKASASLKGAALNEALKSQAWGDGIVCEKNLGSDTVRLGPRLPTLAERRTPSPSA